jgi:hypothetical protein
VGELKGLELEQYKERQSEAEGIESVDRDRSGSILGGILGPIPGNWRPFSDTDAFWNMKVSDASFSETWFEHRHSALIIAEAATKNSGKVSFSGSYNIPIWNVDSTLLTARTGHCNNSNIFETWDTNHNDIVDVPVPWDPGMWGEPYPGNDGHICIVDLNLNQSWEMSRFRYPCTQDANPLHVEHTTFNIWDLTQVGYQNPIWSQFVYGATSRGGRGGGTPEIAGLLRVDEVKYARDNGTEIRHALGFTYEGIKGTSRASDWHLFAHPPCCRADEVNNVPNQLADKYMTYGLRIQLNPSLPESYFTSTLGIQSPHVLVVIRCLQEYGAYLWDYGGGHFKFGRQMLTPNGQAADETAWKSYLGDSLFFSDFNKIKSSDFRVLQWANQRELLWNHNTGVVEVVYQPDVGPS